MDQSLGNDPATEDEIQREIEKLDETNNEQEQRTRILETKAFQIVNMYFVFQGVILAVATTSNASSTVKCNDWWIPLIPSLLAAVLNLIALLDVMCRILKSREDHDQNVADLAFIRIYRTTKTHVTRVLPGTPLALNQHQQQPRAQPQLQGCHSDIVRPKADSIKKWKRRFVFYLSFSLFFGFSIAIMCGCYTLLCSSKEKRGAKLL